MKYSRIPQDELEKLEKEFVDFLVVNGITAEDWVSLKENEPINASKIVDQFSDVVWESILRSTKYLNKVEKDLAYYFFYGNKEISLIRVKKIDSDRIEKQTSTKHYNKVRELEMFEMIQNGCTVSDGEEFISLTE